MRPKQWVKNMFVFIPLFFSGLLFDPTKFFNSLTAFAAFCLAASSIYCLNDLKDAEADRRHPKKKFRPIASGKVSKTSALILLLILAIGGSALPLIISGGWKCCAIIAGYVVLNIFYCLGLKRIALVDVTIISIGFVLRIAAGAMASNVFLSHWIVLMTFLLALFMALTKRRDDVIIYNTTGKLARNNIVRYNLTFLDQANTMVATITVFCYILYSVSDDVTTRLGSHYIYLTSIFVLLGIMRYFQRTIVDKKSGSPTTLLYSDHFLQFCVAGWIVSFLVIIYF